MEKHYMNPATGSVGTYDDWFYENEDGFTVNAVDECGVWEVEWVNDDWELVDQELQFIQ